METITLPLSNLLEKKLILHIDVIESNFSYATLKPTVKTEEGIVIMDIQPTKVYVGDGLKCPNFIKMSITD